MKGAESEAVEASREEIFDTVMDALQPGTICLVPCPHIQSSVECPQKPQTNITNSHQQHTPAMKQHPVGQKSRSEFSPSNLNEDLLVSALMNWPYRSRPGFDQ